MSLNSYVLEASAEIIADVCKELIKANIDDENLLFALNGRFSDLAKTIDVKKYIN
jgi:hypothetical protein